MSDHEQSSSCWLCRSRLPDDLAKRIISAKRVGKGMNAEEAIAWIAGTIGYGDQWIVAVACGEQTTQAVGSDLAG